MQAHGLTPFVPQTDNRIRSPLEARRLEEQLDRLMRERGVPADQLLQMDVSTGLMRPVKDEQTVSERHRVLPLPLGPLQTSLHAIGSGDPWLRQQAPVFYFDEENQVHIDFPSLAGFIVDPMGSILSRAVNPW